MIVANNTFHIIQLTIRYEGVDGESIWFGYSTSVAG
jgi:hypothetical protein